MRALLSGAPEGGGGGMQSQQNFVRNSVKGMFLLQSQIP